MGQAGDRVRADAKGDGRRNAPAIIEYGVAAGDFGIMVQGNHAHRQLVADLAIDVCGDAIEIGGAERGRGRGKIACPRGLADDVDAARRRAAAAQRTARPLEDLDPLHGKGLAGLRADIARAIDKDVAGGIDTADQWDIPRCGAALTGAQRDAGDGAQRVFEGERGGAFQRFLGHHIDGARCIENGRGRSVDRERIRPLARHDDGLIGVSGVLCQRWRTGDETHAAQC